MKSTFFARRAPILAFVTLALFFPTGLFSLKALRSNKNDVQDWLPPEYPETRAFNWFQKNFAEEQFILVSWDGCKLDDQRLPLLVAKMMRQPGKAPSERQMLFSKVMTGPTLLASLTDPDGKMKLTPEQAMERVKGSLIGEDEQTTCAVFTLSSLGDQYTRKAVEAVRDAAINECNIPADKLHLGGPPVDSYAIDKAGEKSLYILGGVALLIGFVVSWWCLRSIPLVLMVVFVGLYAAALSLAILSWAGVNVNAILLTMPPLVYVAAVSGAIHLSNYYRDTVIEEGREGAPERAVLHASLPLGLATSTTAIGLFSLCYSELVPIQMFGFFSAVGVISSLWLLCMFLPSMLQLWPSAIKVENEGHGDPTSGADARRGFWWRWADWIVDHYRLAGAFGVVVLIVMGIGLTRVQTSIQLMRMFPPNAPILKDYQWLEANLGRLVPMEVVVKIDNQRADLKFLQQMRLIEKLHHRVEEIPEIGRAMSAVTFAPPLPDDPGVNSETGRPVWNLRESVTDKRLERSKDDFHEGGFYSEEDGKSLWRISARTWALKDVDYGAFTDEIRQEVERAIGNQEQQREAGIEVVYSGLVPVIYKAQRSLMDGLLFGFVMDLIVVTIVMMLAVREWSAGIVLAIPSIFPAIVVFGTMGWLGTIVDTGTVMAPAVALGVTIDDVVHFMLMYRGGLKRGLSRRESIMLAYKGCARAMYQSWGVIGVGLSVFALSPFMPTKRFGIMMITLLSASLVGNLVVLPAILASPFGKMFGRRFQKRQAELAAAAAAEADDALQARTPHQARVKEAVAP